MKTAALYVRCSTEEQIIHGYTLAAQREALIEYAREHDITVAGIYIDEGISGKALYTKRPELIRMLDNLDGVDMILFVKLDRWFRSVKEYYKVQDILEKHHVTWRAILEDYNTDTADGILKVNIMLSVAQNEAERTSERIRFVNESKVKQKKVVTGRQPFGYTINEHSVVADPVEAPQLIELIEHYITHRSIGHTLEWSNRKWGYTHSRTWLKYLLDKIDVYSGVYRDVADYRPRLLSDETIAAVKEIKATNFVSRKRTGNVHIFSGLLFCPECGTRMISWTDTYVQRRSNTPGLRKVYYLCSKHRNHMGCNYKSTIREEAIEEELLKAIEPQLEALTLKRSKNEEIQNNDLPKLKAQLRRLSDAYILGGLSTDEYKTRMAELKQKIAVAESSQAKRTANPEELRKIFDAGFDDMYSKLSPENKRAFWNRVLSRIDLDGRHVSSLTFR